MTTNQQITMTGNVVETPEIGVTRNGHSHVRMRVAVNRRIRDKETGEWTDKLDGFFTVVAFRGLADNAARTLRRGDRVIVVGTLTTRSWEQEVEGSDQTRTRWITEVEADEIGPSVRWQTWVRGDRQQDADGASTGGTAPPTDGQQASAPAEPDQPDEPAADTEPALAGVAL